MQNSSRRKNQPAVNLLESVPVPTVAMEMQSLCSCSSPNVRRCGGSVASVLGCGPTFRGIEAWSGAEVMKVRISDSDPPAAVNHRLQDGKAVEGFRAMRLLGRP